MKLKTIHLEQTDSTNRWLREHMGEADADITVRSEAELAAALRRLVQFDEPGS